MRQCLMICLLFVCVLSSGCSTISDAKNAKGTGAFRVYDAPLEIVWSTVIDCINTSQLQLVNENREEGYILAQRGFSLDSYGEEVAVFVTALSEKRTRVEIVSKKVLAANIFAPDWSKRLFEAIENRLKIKPAQ